MREKRFLGHSPPLWGGGGGGGGGGDNRVANDIGLYVEELVKIYCMLCPKFKNSTLG